MFECSLFQVPAISAQDYDGEWEQYKLNTHIRFGFDCLSDERLRFCFIASSHNINNINICYNQCFILIIFAWLHSLKLFMNLDTVILLLNNYFDTIPISKFFRVSLNPLYLYKEKKTYLPMFSVTDIQCTFATTGSGIRDSVSALLRKPEGFRGAPLFADDRATDPISDSVCQIRPEPEDPTGLLYRLRITDFTKCGVLKRNVCIRRINIESDI